MNLERIMRKRSVKLFFLLISASLIMTASAAVYYALLMEPEVTISAAPVHFTDGDDSSAAGYSPGTNNTYASLSLKAYPNVTLTYEQAVNVTNTGDSDHDIRLRHVSISPASGDDVGNFTSIIFYLIDAAGNVKATFDYNTTGSSWNTPETTDWMSITQTAEWTIKIETVAVAGAKSVSCSITIAIDVK